MYTHNKQLFVRLLLVSRYCFNGAEAGDPARSPEVLPGWEVGGVSRRVRPLLLLGVFGLGALCCLGF